MVSFTFNPGSVLDRLVYDMSCPILKLNSAILNCPKDVHV